MKSIIVFLGFVIFAIAVEQQAQRSDDFVQSMGTNIHISYGGCTYYDNFELFKTVLINSGIRRFRDGALTGWQLMYDRFSELGDAGFKGQFIFAPTVNITYIQTYPNLVGDVFERYEGPNEFDNSGISDWAAVLQNYTKTLWQFHNTSFKIVAPSLTSETSYPAVGDLSQYVDFGNMHNYKSTFEPETNGWGGTDQYGTYGATIWNMNLSKIVSGKNPILTSETGYQVMNPPSGANAHIYVPSDIHAKYLVRMYLYQFGVLNLPFTYLYEFIDCGTIGSTDYSWGMFSVNATNSSDITPRPAYFLVQSLSNLFSDSVTFTPGILNYNLTGQTSNMFTALFQRSNGTFYLIMWLNQSPWNTNAGGTGESDPGAYQTVTPQEVTLTINITVVEISRYVMNATVGSMLKTNLNIFENNGGRSVNLTITDTPLIVAIVPPAGTSTTGESTATMSTTASTVSSGASSTAAPTTGQESSTTISSGASSTDASTTGQESSTTVSSGASSTDAASTTGQESSDGSSIQLIKIMLFSVVMGCFVL